MVVLIVSFHMNNGATAFILKVKQYFGVKFHRLALNKLLFFLIPFLLSCCVYILMVFEPTKLDSVSIFQMLMKKRQYGATK